MKTHEIAVIGNWHLASVTAGVLSSKKHQVLWVNHEGSSQPWTKFPKCPVHEPGLEDLFIKGRALENIDYANDFTSWFATSIWIAIDTPVNENDEADVTPLKKALEEIKKHQKFCERVLISSQVPLGFCAEAEAYLKLPVIYVPENLRLGKGIETFERADRTVLGASKLENAVQAQEDIFADFSTKFLLCNLETSEMVKHATNAFLATSISFANQMAVIGEAYGVDNFTVGKALKMDLRIGSGAYVMPGLGFAGGTLPRDLRTLKNLAARKDLPIDFVDAVLDINAKTTDVLIAGAEKHLREVSGPVLILGYTYKADTDTLRRSLSIDVAEALSKKGHRVLGFDPMMNGKDCSAITPYLKHVESLEGLEAPAVVMLMTPREAFKKIDWKQLPKSARTLVMDAHGFLRADEITPHGLAYKALWAAQQNPGQGKK